MLHYFFNTYFLFYLCTSLEFWTIIGTVQIQLIHRTYQLRVLDYYIGIGNGGLYVISVGAELEWALRNESENETENGHFRNSNGMV